LNGLGAANPRTMPERARWGDQISVCAAEIRRRDDVRRAIRVLMEKSCAIALDGVA
jgi:hypothetical protein